MIFVDNTYCPLTVLGVLPEATRIPSEFGCNESRLWSSQHLALALIVPGRGVNAPGVAEYDIDR